MNNPTKDGSSKDYYPERYTGSSDNGGVHWNSGIANLFFYLLSDGGAHPRGKAGGATVSGIGRDKAIKIWYRALSQYFPNSCTFAQARAHSVTAAEDLYGLTSNEVHSVKKAWFVVGVGADPGPGNQPSGECITGTGWTQVPGGLKHISVNEDGYVWGVNSNDNIYYDSTFPPGQWTQVSGGLKYISSGKGSRPAWGVNVHDNIYYRSGSSWTQVSGGLKGVSVSANGKYVWGVNSNDNIYYWNGNGWTQVSGGLKQVSACSDGSVWGVNSNDMIYYRPAPATSTNWVQVPGGLKHVSCSDINTVWGVNSNDNIYVRQNNAWTLISGGLKQISVGARNLVVGVNSNDQIYYRNFPSNC
jgi:hypothetical protein